jgi:hypothetical protein
VFEIRKRDFALRTLELVLLPNIVRPEDMRPVRLFHPMWMYCRVTNSADETIFVYGPRHHSETTTIPTSLFVLHPRQLTPTRWDCKGILIPSDRVAQNGAEVIHGPVALKYRDMRRVIVTAKNGRYTCPRCDGVMKSSQIDFAVPLTPYQELLALHRRLVEL